jgi:hypothetical protein
MKSRKMLFVVFVFVMMLISCNPEMPISVTYREALFDKSLVAQFHNNSDRYLIVLVKLENKTLSETKNGKLELAPRETKEIGWAEGWKFVSGEYITITHEDYSVKTVRAP